MTDEAINMQICPIYFENVAIDPGIEIESNGEEKDSNRSRFGIIESGLKVSQYGATKIDIRNKARLPQDLLDEVYLPYCLANEFLEQNEKNDVYQMTEKGRQYLKRFDELRKLLRSETFRRT